MPDGAARSDFNTDGQFFYGGDTDAGLKSAFGNRQSSFNVGSSVLDPTGAMDYGTPQFDTWSAGVRGGTDPITRIGADGRVFDTLQATDTGTPWMDALDAASPFIAGAAVLGAGAAGLGAGAGAGAADAGFAYGGGEVAGADLAGVPYGGGADYVPGMSNLAAPSGGELFAGAVPGAGGGGGGGGDPNDPTAAGGAPAGPAMIDATMPTVPMSPETMQMLGISPPSFTADFSGAGAFGDSAGGMVPGGYDSSIYTGGAPTDAASPLADQTVAPAEDDWLKKGGDMFKKLGISPGTAAQLGISGIQALSKPKLPAAAQKLGDIGGAGAASASAMIQSGGASGPAWTQQKASIDATIDQQITQQTQALVQQAINSGQGADSQLVQQQTNKLKNDLETKRQQLYAQAQETNVKTALSQLGISDQALAQVANAQYRTSEEAKQAAAATAQNALMLQALSKNRNPNKDEADAATA